MYNVLYRIICTGKSVHTMYRFVQFAQKNPYVLCIVSFNSYRKVCTLWIISHVRIVYSHRIIANQEFVKYMATFGYHPIKHKPGLWFQDKKMPSLALWSMIFEFSIPPWIMPTICECPQRKYLIKVDMEATVYIGIKLDWDYMHITVTLSIPNYVSKAFHIFQHIMMGSKEYPPHICAPIKYGQKIQYVNTLDAAQ